MELLQLNELLSALMEFASQFEDRYKEQLAASGRYTTEYKLIDSVKTQVVVGEHGYDVIMSLNDYWKYVEEDTHHKKFPPKEKILEWIQIKPIIPKPDALGRTPTENQLAYLIGRKIKNEGTEGSHDLAKTKDELIPQFRERISAALGHDVLDYIAKVVRE